MAPLKNARKEKFCQLRVKGHTQDEAYRLAGYRPDRSHAARLAAKGHIGQRIRELQSNAARRAEVTHERVLREYARIAFSDPRDIQKFGTGELTDDQAAALKVTTHQRQVIGKKGKKIVSTSYYVTQHDKLKALDKLEEDTRPLEDDRGPTLVVANILNVQGYQ